MNCERIRMRAGRGFTSIMLGWLAAAGCVQPATDVIQGGAGQQVTADNSNGSAVGGDSARPAASAPDELTVDYPACSAPAEAQSWKLTILELVNRERSKAGLRTLNVNATLEREAETYACEMIQHDFFAHVNPVDGSDLASRARAFSYSYQFIGENLAAGQHSPEEAFTDWMNSPGHRQNIMNEAFVEIGIGVRSGGSYGLYWVQEFGEPLSQSPTPFR
jgi:uncharacterized protein YkwD